MTIWPRGALHHLDPLWDELFPAEQARIVQLLVERAGIGTAGRSVSLRIDGLAALAREMTADLERAAGSATRRSSKPSPLQVPFCVVKRGGRKEMLLPLGTSAVRARVDNLLVKALFRAFRWKRLLASEEFATIADAAECVCMPPSYMIRMLRLTLLTLHRSGDPRGAQGPAVTLARVLEPFPEALQ